MLMIGIHETDFLQQELDERGIPYELSPAQVLGACLWYLLSVMQFNFDLSLYIP